MPSFVGCLLISFWVTRLLEMRYQQLWLHIAGRFYQYNQWVTRVLEMLYRHLWRNITGWFINIVIGC